VVAAHYIKDDPLNCWTSSSDISVYHVEFHEDCYRKLTKSSSQRSIPTTVKSGSSTLQ